MHKAESSLWQHPFVNVFKHLNLGVDWKQSQKKGEVKELLVSPR